MLSSLWVISSYCTGVISFYCFESHIMLLLLSHISPYYLWVILLYCFWVTYHPTVCESCASPTFVSIALFFVSHILPTTVCESYVKLFLWGTSYTTVWVMCRPTVCTSRDSLLLWVSIALLLESHVAPPAVYESYVILFCESRIRLLFLVTRRPTVCKSHVALIFVGHI